MHENLSVTTNEEVKWDKVSGSRWLGDASHHHQASHHKILRPDDLL